MNIICVICSEILSSAAEPIVTKCGHVFHYVCLAQWLERSKTCPQCRNRTTEQSIIRLYFTIASLEGIKDDVVSLQEKVDNVKLELMEKTKTIESLTSEKMAIDILQKNAKTVIKTLEQAKKQQESINGHYKKQIEQLQLQVAGLGGIKTRNEQLESELRLMQNITDILKGTATEVDEIVKEQDAQSLATYLTVVKRELVSSEHKRQDMKSIIKRMQLDLLAAKSHRNKLIQDTDTNKQLEEELRKCESDKQKLFSRLRELENMQLASQQAQTSAGAFRKRKLITEKTEEDGSPSINAKVQAITNSNSPYLNIKSSSVGITPLVRPGRTTMPNIGKPNKFTIFKNLRPDPNPPKNLTTHVFDGLGGQCRVSDFKIVSPSRENLKCTRPHKTLKKSSKVANIEFIVDPK